MSKIEYRIVEEEYRHHLENEVNKLLAEGWKLQGGVSGYSKSHAHISGRASYTQAMIREEKY